MKRKTPPTKKVNSSKKVKDGNVLVQYEQQTTSDWQSFKEDGYQNFFIKDKVIDPITGTSLATELLEALLARQLITVQIEGCTIGALSMSYVVRGFNQNFSIQELSLQGCLLDSRGFKTFVKSLSTVSNLSALNLSGIGLTDKTTVSLSKAIRKLELRKIVLSTNSIKDKGAKAIAKYAPNSLTTIDLRKNKIGDAGAKAITLKLKTISKVEEVWLGENQIDQEGALSLSELFSLPKLTLLNLQDNPFSSSETASTFLVEVFDKQQATKTTVRPVLKESLSTFPSAPLTVIEEYFEGGHHQNFNFFPKVVLTKEEESRNKLVLEKIIEATEKGIGPDKLLETLADILGIKNTTLQTPAITTTGAIGEVGGDHFDMGALMDSLEMPTSNS